MIFVVMAFPRCVVPQEHTRRGSGQPPHQQPERHRQRQHGARPSAAPAASPRPIPQAACRQYCVTAAPSAIWVKPMMPAAVPAACGRTLTAPEIAPGSSRPLPKFTISCGPNTMNGPQDIANVASTAASATPSDFEADARPDHPVDAEARRQPRGAEIAGHVADRRNREPDAVFRGAALHQRDDDVRPAAEERKERRRAERAGADIAGEFRAASRRARSRKKPCARPAVRSARGFPAARWRPRPPRSRW